VRVDIIAGALCLALAGCTQPSTPPPPGTGGSGDAGSGTAQWLPTSGTRLKVKYIQTPDGARQAWGWYDSQLGQDCYFTATQDAGVRCVVQGYDGTQEPGQYAPAQVLTE
jgi:hypothetical protein